MVLFWLLAVLEQKLDKFSTLWQARVHAHWDLNVHAKRFSHLIVERSLWIVHNYQSPVWLNFWVKLIFLGIGMSVFGCVRLYSLSLVLGKLWLHPTLPKFANIFQNLVTPHVSALQKWPNSGYFLHFGHPDPEGSGRVSQQDCLQMPSYHLKPKSALKQIN